MRPVETRELQADNGGGCSELWEVCILDALMSILPRWQMVAVKHCTMTDGTSSCSVLRGWFGT